MAAIARLEGWEGRLAAVLESARAEPYRLGVHDCFSVACRVQRALTGAYHWPEFEGRYSTRRDALRLLAAHGKTVNEAAEKIFGSRTYPAANARRGDVVKYVSDEPHLGICVGAQVAVLGEKGLEFVPLLSCECCWRLG